MRYFVKIKPSSSQEKIILTDKTHIVIHVTVPAEKGRANKAMIKLLAGYFDIPQSLIKIVAGMKNREKIVEI